MSAATIRATPWPVVHVEDRPESSATWRTYQDLTNSTAAARCAASSSTATPSTRTRERIGTQPSPCSPSTHASTRALGTPSACPTAVRSRSPSLAV